MPDNAVTRFIKFASTLAGHQPVLGVRNEGLADLTDTDGELTNIAVDGKGRLILVSSGGGATSDVNLVGINNVVPSVGVGASGTGTLRVILSSDSTVGISAGSAVIGHVIVDSGVITVNGTIAFSNSTIAVTNAGTFAVQATLSAETTKVIGTVNIASGQTIALAAGSAVIGHVIVDSGAITVSGTVAFSNTTIAVTNVGTFAVQATLAAETTKVIGVVRTADGSGNLLTSTGAALDVNLKTSSITLTVAGAKSNNAAVPGATNIGALVAIANASPQTWTEGREVLLSTDLAGSLRTTLSASSSVIGHVIVDSGVMDIDSIISSINPGSAASNLGKQDSGFYTAGDVGVASLGVVDDGTTFIPALNFYTPPRIDPTTHGMLVKLTASTAVIGHVIVDSGAITVSGTVTANAGTNLNTSALALEAGNLATLAGIVTSARAAVNLISGQAGVQGNSGIVTATTQRVVLATDIALPAGTNVIGHVIVDSGAITVSGTVAFSNSTIAVTNAGTFAVQATLSAETTKVIGTVNIASGQTVGLVAGSAVIGHVIVDSGAITITPSGTQDVNLTKVGGATIAIGQAAMAASLPVVLASNQSSIPVAATLSAETTKVIGTVNQGTSPWVVSLTSTTVTGTVAVTQSTSPWLIAGAAASGAAKSGNPVQIGGVFNTTQPTVTTGQAVEAQSTARGAQIVATGVDAFAVNATLSAETTKVIGTINIASGQTVGLVAGSAVIGHVIVDSGAITVSGTVTANAGTNLNTSLLALESGGNLATLAGIVTSSRAAVNPISGQAGVQGNTGTVSATTQRVVLATDVALPAGTNNIGFVTPTPSTTGGWSKIMYAAQTTTVRTPKGTAATFGGYYFYNPNATVAYVQVFDAATATTITLGTTVPDMIFAIPGGSAANLEFGNGVNMANGIKLACTTTATGSTAPGTGLDLTVFYK